MSTERIAPNRLSFHLVPLPKGVKGTRGAVFVGGEPAGTYAKSTNKTFLCTATSTIALGIPEAAAPLGPETVYAGTLWTGKKNAARAMAWTIRGAAAIGCALPSANFAASFAAAADGAHVVGTGEPPGDAPSRAVLWIGGQEPPSLLANPHDPTASTAAYAVSGDTQGGSSGGMDSDACIWHGSTESIVMLPPPEIFASCVRAVCGSEQAGDFVRSIETSALKRAALWRGSADSFVDLTPDGVAIASATACVDRFQAGWIEEAPRSQRFRAWLWAGSAASSIDLHSMVGGDWTSSSVYRAHLDGRRLLLLGTVEKRQQVGGFNTLMAEQACWWEYALP
jgi:hypothetical protein